MFPPATWYRKTRQQEGRKMADIHKPGKEVQSKQSENIEKQQLSQKSGGDDQLHDARTARPEIAGKPNFSDTQLKKLADQASTFPEHRESGANETTIADLGKATQEAIEKLKKGDPSAANELLEANNEVAKKLQTKMTALQSQIEYHKTFA